MALSLNKTRLNSIESQPKKVVVVVDFVVVKIFIVVVVVVMAKLSLVPV